MRWLWPHKDDTQEDRLKRLEVWVFLLLVMDAPRSALGLFEKASIVFAGN